VPAAPADSGFAAFSSETLQRATSLAREPDVKALMALREDVLAEGRKSGSAAQSLEPLLVEIDRLTNDARARRLQLDREALLRARGQK
jgi:hypothetical protein